ncbi:hypothetical protein Taro_028114 [Colocasia esculenta]|uniref:Uncharacterized protein n=1 Tax=Colocasia esculenta TaxID=4460 RepID=A0A843VGD3_COLES|nr:hypothetical protein [Colocasia esculenta]
MQPRSRFKTVDCAPLGFSDLLKKGTTRSKSSKRKSRLLAHKTARHILRKHSIMDQGQEADLFSVLETSPNLHADLSQIKMPWSPGCVTASPQLLKRSVENLSSGHKKAHSRFKSQIPVSYASPEVLKPVKNIVLHEKYIDELHCREARRRMCDKTACSAGAEDGKENVVVKDDVVKAAKNALVCEAKGIIMCGLGHSQSSPSSNSEDTYGCEEEGEEDM